VVVLGRDADRDERGADDEDEDVEDSGEAALAQDDAGWQGSNRSWRWWLAMDHASYYTSFAISALTLRSGWVLARRYPLPRWSDEVGDLPLPASAGLSMSCWNRLLIYAANSRSSKNGRKSGLLGLLGLLGKHHSGPSTTQNR
jgi:hypothetical protein